MSYPVEVEERVREAGGIVLGHVVERHPYLVAESGMVNTLNIFQVDAWFKGNTGEDKVAVITLGGVLDDKASVVHPALQLDDYNEYILFLEGDNFQIDDKAYRLENPNMVQTLTYADAQGAFTKQFGKYHDLYVWPVMEEDEMFRRLTKLTGEPVLTPEGLPFDPRPYTGPEQRVMPITGMSPNPAHAGTIDPADFLDITGSGFGGTAGTMFYSNADDGGATFTASGVASDNLSWADNAITNKVARRAGTGPINVNGAMTSGSDLTVDYAHIEINSSFAGWGSTTRQRYYHVNKNGSGGYDFVYNNSFAANAPAVAAFERALDTWRCATFINWFSNGTTATATVANDGQNVIFFDASLPAGVLGRATSQFSGSATGACNTANTVWWVDGIDVQFKPDPPSGCCTWNYGPAASGFFNFDFESVAVHELGHAHGLGHRISSGDVMHFSLTNGVDARSPSAEEITGGTVRMTYSSQPLCFYPAGVTSEMVLLSPATCILPVLYYEIQGRHYPGVGNVIEWSTLRETDNHGFEVQRSVDGVNFTSVGFVSGSRDSERRENYSFTDSDIAPIRYFYRLRQMDVNGESHLSPIVEVLSGTESSVTVMIDNEDRQLIVSAYLANQTGTLEIYALDGRFMGSHSLNDQVTRIDLSTLAAGMYLYRIHGGAEQSGKLLITR